MGPYFTIMFLLVKELKLIYINLIVMEKNVHLRLQRKATIFTSNRFRMVGPCD